MTRALEFTEDPAANAYLAEDPLALLIGMLLDQQVPIEWAFMGPWTLRHRLEKELSAEDLAAMDVDELVDVFREKPAMHRYPANMAKRTHTLSRFIVEHYGGDAAAVWNTAQNGRDLYDRLLELPGFGEMKARTLLGILGKQLGAAPQGWEELLPDHMTLADVTSADDLAEYREIKRALKEGGGG